MTNRDPELDELLAPLRREMPDALSMARWKRRLRPLPRYPQLVAAAVAGFALGAFVLLALRGNGALVASGCPGSAIFAAKNISDDATVERSHVKLD